MVPDEVVQPGFSIGELARRTGVPSGTLRTWEVRYGEPRASRSARGHRRYGPEAVRTVERILGHRSAGLSLEAAVARVAAEQAGPAPSVFATLRARHPELPARELRKTTVLALSRALEDEYVARAERAVLFAAFQRERFFRHSEQRWRDLARTADLTAVFADFPRPAAATAAGGLIEVPLEDDSPLRREWVLVCDGAGYTACLAAWERAGQAEAPDRERRFETVWSVDPGVVRTAARVCAAALRPQLADHGAGLDRRLADDPTRASADLRRAGDLFHRLLGYLDGDRSGPG